MARQGASFKSFLKRAEKYLKVNDFGAATTVLRDGLTAFPDNARLLHLAGRTAFQLGDYHGATDLLRSSLKSAPKAETFCDLGYVHWAQGNLQDATGCFRSAIGHDSKYHPGHVNLGHLLRNQGDMTGALDAFHAAFQLAPRDMDCVLGLSSVLGLLLTDKHNPIIENMLTGVFEAKGADYDALASAAANQLIHKFGIQANGACARALDPKDPLLHQYLTKCLNISPAMEFALTRLRRDLLLGGTEKCDEDSSDMAVLIALQCFHNEFVFFSEPDEDKAVGAIQDNIEAALASGETSESFDAEALLLAMYRPLTAVDGAEDHVEVFETVNFSGFHDIVQIALKDHLEEQALKPKIESFSEIEDRTSRDVRGQYEEHPFPRWVHLPYADPINLAFALQSNFPHFLPPEFLHDPKTILVAGCGTGRHAASVAQQWPKADILAIDLSTASIAYAMRNLKKLHIGNVQFLHGDILEAEKLGGPFDMVQSVGVLHHMKEPVEGWRILSRLIRNGGVFRCGLYSERGRQGVFAARRAIAEEEIASDRAGIANFRRRILQDGAPGEYSKLVELMDFYSTSNCRDLMFHVHEDNYTPLRLKAEIEDVGLVFLGFEKYEERGANDEYRKRFPDDPALTNLDNWEEFEKSRDQPFEGYDFWCWKPE